MVNKKENAALTKVKSRWAAGEADRAYLDKEYKRNHGIYTNHADTVWEDIVLPDGASKRQLNKAFAVERALRSKILPTLGDFKAKPVEESDRGYADICTRWFEWFRAIRNWPTFKNRIVKGCILYNDMAIEVYFDPTDNYPEGSIKLRALYPWEYGVDPIGNEWVIIESYIPKGQLKTLYPGKKELIEKSPDAERPMRWGSGYGPTYIKADGTKRKEGDDLGKAIGYVRVLTLYEKSYDWETIKKEETEKAVAEEWQAFL
ncbi:unnamed protein product, partial [marine sediment metagenome]